MTSSRILILLLVLVLDITAVPVQPTPEFQTTNQYIIVPRRQDGLLSVQSNQQFQDKPAIQIFGEHVANAHGGKVLRYFEIGSWKALLYQAPETSGNSSLDQDPHVEYVEPDRYVRAYPAETSQDWGVHIPMNSTDADEPMSVCIEQFAGGDVWGLSRMSSRVKPDYDVSPYKFTNEDAGDGVDIYVADTGVRKDHVEFKEGQVTLGFKPSGMPEGMGDMNGHGTHVSSLAVGRTVGVAKNAKIISVKVLNTDGAGLISWILEGLAWIAKREATEMDFGHVPRSAVINLSLGMAGISYVLDNALQAIVQEQGIPVVAAAGNAHSDACLDSPGRMASVITVASTDRSDHMAYFSNFGPCVDVMAPGLDIKGASNRSRHAYISYSGTSQSTGYVSGIVARYLSSVKDARITPAFIKAYLSDTASYGYVWLSGSEEETTPNRLVYRACDSLPGYRPAVQLYTTDYKSQLVRLSILIPLVAVVLMVSALLYILLCNF